MPSLLQKTTGPFRIPWYETVLILTIVASECGSLRHCLSNTSTHPPAKLTSIARTTKTGAGMFFGTNARFRRNQQRCFWLWSRRFGEKEFPDFCSGQAVPDPSIVDTAICHSVMPPDNPTFLASHSIAARG